MAVMDHLLSPTFICDSCTVNPGSVTHHLSASISSHKAGSLVYKINLVLGHWLCGLSLAVTWKVTGQETFPPWRVYTVAGEHPISGVRKLCPIRAVWP